MTKEQHYPCELPLKIIGHNQPHFERQVITVLEDGIDVLATKSNLSRDNKYLSLTLTVQAASQAALNQTYENISSLPFVKLVL